MASLYKKMISGKPYWYLREMGWVDGKPKMVSERYVGTAADIEALLDAREQAIELPRVFRTGNSRLFHAAACPFRYSSRTSCGVRYPSVE